MALESGLGLGLISTYDDSDEEDRGNEESTLKLDTCSKTSSHKALKLDSSIPKSRLPLPSSIAQLYKDTPDLNKVPEDDPEQHEGRIRSFPHQRGNWSTYVYVPYDKGEEFLILLKSLQTCTARAGVEMLLIADPHISLTRTVVLFHHWIENFVTSVKTKLSQFHSFPVVLGPPSIYCNEERTRTFLGLQVTTGSDQLVEASRALDQCLSEFRLPPFYEDPSFHLSVLWVLGDARIALEKLLPTLHTEFLSHSLELRTVVTNCLCKTGNKTFSFPLTSR